MRGPINANLGEQPGTSHMKILRVLFGFALACAVMFVMPVAAATFEPLSLDVPLHATIPDGRADIIVQPVHAKGISGDYFFALDTKINVLNIVGDAHRHIDPGRRGA